METVYILEDGHIFDNEDTMLFFSYKIHDLREQGYTKEEIRYFDDSEAWMSLCSKIDECKVP